LWRKRHKPNRPTVPTWRRAGISIHHRIAARICSAARRKIHGGKMTRTKSRRRFPSDGCPGPLGDPLVCTAFLDDSTPVDSDDLTVLVEAVGSEFVVLRSPDTAEHDPDYREVGRFPTREQALEFLAADG